MLKELPEKWCCKGYEEVAKYSCKHGECPPYYETVSKNIKSYHHYPRPYVGVTTSDQIHKGYVEITLEEFKRFLLPGIKERIKNLKI